MQRRLGQQLLVLPFIGLALATGAIAVARPFAGAGMAGALLVGTLIALFGTRLPRAFLVCLGVLLIGYAVAGHGFAYVGIPPLYIGEIVLAVGLAAALVNDGLGIALRAPVAWIWLALAGWGALRTVPYLGTYRIDALRDAAVWGYGAYALLIAAFLQRYGGLPVVTDWFARTQPYFICWVPFLWASTRLGLDRVPRLPTTGTPLFEFSPSCVAVHLAGTGAFLLLDLHRTGPATGKRGPALSSGLLWIVWFVSFSLVAIWTRGGALGVMIALLVVLVARPRAARKLAFVGSVGLVVSLAFAAFDLSFDTGEYRGKISPQELIGNVASIFHEDKADRANREGNRTWRLEWWNTILGYTLHGPLFWTGKGFGVNLADDDGFQVTADHSLRSPHNGHLTFLARAGVPGVVLWLVLQVAFALTMARAYLRARRARNEWWQRVDLWIIAYWLSFLVNAAFDVFIEGPQGGIWFYSVIGFGLVAAEQQRRLVRTTGLAAIGAAGLATSGGTT